MHVLSVARPDRDPLVMSMTTDNRSVAMNVAQQLVAGGVEWTILHSISEGMLVPIHRFYGKNGKVKGKALSNSLPAPAVLAVTSERTDQAAIEQAAEESDSDVYEAYCVKCNEKRQFHGEIVEMANGRHRAAGNCPVCGTKVTRILSKADVDAHQAHSNSVRPAETGLESDETAEIPQTVNTPPEFPAVSTPMLREAQASVALDGETQSFESQDPVAQVAENVAEAVEKVAEAVVAAVEFSHEEKPARTPRKRGGRKARAEQPADTPEKQEAGSYTVTNPAVK